MGRDSIERFLAIVRRDLIGCDVQLLSDEPTPASLDDVILTSLPDGRCLVIISGADAPDNATLNARLQTLIECFPTILGQSLRRRPPPPEALHAELVDVAQLPGIVDALVIDVASPVVWASAQAGSPPMRMAHVSRHTPAELDVSAGVSELVKRALGELRQRHDLDTRRRGGAARFLVYDSDFSVFARGFADIYLLVLVFDGPFDELAVERLTKGLLPRIEELVLALPDYDPDPDPGCKVVALRRC
jgi:hypothetical protein